MYYSSCEPWFTFFGINSIFAIHPVKFDRLVTNGLMKNAYQNIMTILATRSVWPKPSYFETNAAKKKLKTFSKPSLHQLCWYCRGPTSEENRSASMKRTKDRARLSFIDWRRLYLLGCIKFCFFANFKKKNTGYASLGF